MFGHIHLIGKWLFCHLNLSTVLSLKLTTFSPLGVLAGSFLLLFPEKGGKPETTKDKIIAMLVFGIGLVVGLFNLYLMDLGFFGK